VCPFSTRGPFSPPFEHALLEPVGSDGYKEIDTGEHFEMGHVTRSLSFFPFSIRRGHFGQKEKRMGSIGVAYNSIAVDFFFPLSSFSVPRFLFSLVSPPRNFL